MDQEPLDPNAGVDVDANDESARRDAANCARNVKLQYVLQSVLAINYGIMLGPVFDYYIYELGHEKNSVVGMVESVSGITSLIVAIPVGCLVDRRPKERALILKHTSLLGLVSFGLILGAFWLDHFYLLFGALIVLGLFQEVVSSASDAVFTDSLPRGDRSKYFTRKSMLQTGFAALGPLISGITFLVIGDEWTLYRMRSMLIAGACTLPVASILLRFFKDPLAAGKKLEEKMPENRGRTHSGFACLGAKQVPYIIGCGDFIVCIGAGMTVKFFSLFFINDIQFSASDICWLNTAYPLGIAVFMQVLQRAAKPCGRAPSSILFFMMSVLCITLMWKVRSVPALVAIYLVRGAFANCVDPIMRSILMDYTPSTQRGMWNAIGSLMGATWSGSAFIGGLLSDSHDYRFTFMVTGAVYFSACVVYSPLLCIVPRKEKDLADTDSADSLTAPLDITRHESGMSLPPMLGDGPSLKDLADMAPADSLATPLDCAHDYSGMSLPPLMGDGPSLNDLADMAPADSLATPLDCAHQDAGMSLLPLSGDGSSVPPVMGA